MLAKWEKHQRQLDALIKREVGKGTHPKGAIPVSALQQLPHDHPYRDSFQGTDREWIVVGPLEKPLSELGR